MASIPLSSNQVTHQLEQPHGFERAPSRASLALTSPDRLRRAYRHHGPLRLGNENPGVFASGTQHVWGPTHQELSSSSRRPFGAIQASHVAAAAEARVSPHRRQSLHGSVCAQPTTPTRGGGPETVSPQRVSPMRSSLQLCGNGNQQHTPWRPRPPWLEQENRNNNEEDEIENTMTRLNESVDLRIEEEERRSGRENEDVSGGDQDHRWWWQQQHLTQPTAETNSIPMRLPHGERMTVGMADLGVDAGVARSRSGRPTSRGLQIHRQIAGF